MRFAAFLAATLITTGAAAAPTPPELRLPATVVPSDGILELTIDPAKPTFTGRATYEVTLEKEDASIIWLNATGLEISSASATASGREYDARVVPGNDDMVGLAFDPPVPQGKAQLMVEWSGTIDSERSLGLYRVAEKPGEWYAFTFFEATDARRAFPCFDEPSFKHTWRLILHVPAKDVALANAPVYDEKPEAGGMKIVRFSRTRPLPSYLVAFIVGPFDVVDGGVAGHHGTKLRFAIPRGRAAELHYARAVLPRIVGLLEDYFGKAIPYGKLDVAVTPRFWGTMEHPGLVALGQPLMLIKPDEETVEKRRFSAWISIHELCHYWFGDLVTAAWWDDVWLNEALGTWMDRKITDELEPAWQIPVAQAAGVGSAMRLDALPSAKKIRQPVTSRDDIANAFDARITYSKGAAVLRMFELWIGKPRWRDFIHDYLGRHTDGNATSEDFLDAMAGYATRDGAAGMKTFLDQPGVPIVTARKVCAPNAPARLELAQAPYAPPGVPAPADRGWIFPVCARWSTGRSCVLLTGKTGVLALGHAPGCPAWVLPNSDASGYYRMDLDEATLAALGRAPLSLLERVRLLDDVGELASSGRLPIPSALALVSGLAAQKSSHLVDASVSLVRLIRRDLLDDAGRAQLARFVDKTYGPALRAAGLAPRKNDDDDARARRLALIDVVGSAGGDAGLRRDATKLVGRWLDDRKSVPNDVALHLLGIATREGDAALFDRVLAEARKTSERNEREALLSSLGAFPGRELGDKALALIGGGDLDLRSTIGILGRRMMLADQPEAREQAWTWLQAHFEELVGKMREDEAMHLIGLADVWCDPAHRAAVAAFLGPRVAKVPGGPRELANSLETVDVCIAKQARTAEAQRAFLARY